MNKRHSTNSTASRLLHITPPDRQSSLLTNRYYTSENASKLFYIPSRDRKSSHFSSRHSSSENSSRRYNNSPPDRQSSILTTRHSSTENGSKLLHVQLPARHSSLLTSRQSSSENLSRRLHISLPGRQSSLLHRESYDEGIWEFNEDDGKSFKMEEVIDMKEKRLDKFSTTRIHSKAVTIPLSDPSASILRPQLFDIGNIQNIVNEGGAPEMQQSLMIRSYIDDMLGPTDEKKDFKLSLGEITAFVEHDIDANGTSSTQTKVKGLPQVMLQEPADAGRRLVFLKTTINAYFTNLPRDKDEAPVGFMCGLKLRFLARKKDEDVQCREQEIRTIRDCLTQVRNIRKHFAGVENWYKIERLVQIDYSKRPKNVNWGDLQYIAP